MVVAAAWIRAVVLVETEADLPIAPPGETTTQRWGGAGGGAAEMFDLRSACSHVAFGEPVQLSSLWSASMHKEQLFALTD